MAQERFEIGEKEKHSLTVEVVGILEHVKVQPGGVIVADKMLNPLLPKKLRLDIVTSEPHDVEIAVGPFYPFPMELKVDGVKTNPLL